MFLEIKLREENKKRAPFNYLNLNKISKFDPSVLYVLD